MRLISCPIGFKISFFLLIAVFIFSTAHAKDELDSLKSILKNSHSDTSRVFVLQEISLYFKNVASSKDSSIYFASEAVAIAYDSDQTSLIAAAENALGNSYQAFGQYDSALNHFTISKELMISNQLTKGLAGLYNNIGIAYDETGNYEKALGNYFDGLVIAEDQANLSRQASILNNIGIVFKKQKEYDKVLEYYKKTLDIYTELKHDFGMAAIQGNIGSVLIKIGDFNQSINYSLQAKKGYLELGYDRYVPYTIGNLAIANDSLGNNNKSWTLYMEALEKHLQNDNNYEASFNAKNLALLLLKVGQTKEANLYSKQAVELAIKANAKEMLQDAYFAQASTLSKLGRHEEAFKSQKLYMILRDSLFEQQKTKGIFELQTKYETEKKEQKIAAQNIQLAEEKAINQRNTIFIIALILLVIIILAVAGLIRIKLRENQQKRLHQKDLEAESLQRTAVITSQDDERKRFATDLHDGFGQMISILKLNIESLNGNENKQATDNKVFDKSKEMLDQMYDDLQDICFNLMPQTLVHKGLTEALQEFPARINVSGKFKIEVISFGLKERLNDLVEVSLYRIIQEWTNNILKYSNGDKITIQLTADQEELTLMIEDDGAGFDKKLLEQGKGNGWKNIHSRAELVNAELWLDTNAKSKGSTFTLNVRLITVE